MPPNPFAYLPHAGMTHDQPHDTSDVLRAPALARAALKGGYDALIGQPLEPFNQMLDENNLYQKQFVPLRSPAQQGSPGAYMSALPTGAEETAETVGGLASMLVPIPMKAFPGASVTKSAGKSMLSGLDQLFTRSQMSNLQKLDPVNQVAVIREAARNAGALSLLKQIPENATAMPGPLSMDGLQSPARRKFIKQASALAARAALPNVPLPGIAQVAKMAVDPEAGIANAITSGVKGEIAQGLSPKAFLSSFLKDWHTKLAEGSDEAGTIGEEYASRIQALKREQPKGTPKADLERLAAEEMGRAVGLKFPPNIDPRHLVDQASDIHDNILNVDWMTEGNNKELARSLPGFKTGQGINPNPKLDTWFEGGQDDHISKFENWANKHFYTPNQNLTQHLKPEDIRELHGNLTNHVYDEFDPGEAFESSPDSFHGIIGDAWDGAHEWIWDQKK